MYVLGHTGLTAVTVRAVSPEADLRLPMLLSILPDLIDKPVAILLPALVNGNTRNFGHTLLGASVVLAALLVWRRRPGNPWLLWGCYLGHFLLDRMWLNEGPLILLWPFFGPFPRWSPHRPRTPHLMAYDIAGEAIGLSLLLTLSLRHRLYERSRWKAFLKTGRLTPALPPPS